MKHSGRLTPSPSSPRVVVVGAGVGGLAAAAMLARAGLEVLVLEAHVYPGGCAGTFYHQGFRFDAGATLAGGFYPDGPMDVVAEATGVRRWPTHPIEPAMIVHLPDGLSIPRFGDERRFDVRQRVFGQRSAKFWEWQERTADAMWDFALRLPPWPPQSIGQAAELIKHAASWIRAHARHRNPQLVMDSLRSAGSHIRADDPLLRLFVDAQLLISAQTTSKHANALFAAAALDLPRRGAVHVDGGMGAIAETLAAALASHGGKIRYRQQVTHVHMKAGRPTAVVTRRGEVYPADLVIFNLPPWNIQRLLGPEATGRLRKLPDRPRDGWGAFMVYVGLQESSVPSDMPLHHQIVTDRPLAEGNTVFLSVSPEGDLNRAPLDHRALTLSTHTAYSPWWELFESQRDAYEARKEVYAQRMLKAAEQVIPGLRDSATLILPGTPVTFERFTRRKWGWVGGFPQTSLWRAWGPRLGPGLYMVGDSIFPGQSTPAVAMGGVRVARGILTSRGIRIQKAAAPQPLQPFKEAVRATSKDEAGQVPGDWGANGGSPESPSTSSGAPATWTWPDKRKDKKPA